ncbi:MAG: hypothetical protein M3Y21_06015 [Candidatus Eremiobacteraeota bacterium]|nr:hypothetical protein [Candidatus Eremiobacteraeota bacterium]
MATIRKPHSSFYDISRYEEALYTAAGIFGKENHVKNLRGKRRWHVINLHSLISNVCIYYRTYGAIFDLGCLVRPDISEMRLAIHNIERGLREFGCESFEELEKKCGFTFSLLPFPPYPPGFTPTPDDMLWFFKRVYPGGEPRPCDVSGILARADERARQQAAATRAPNPPAATPAIIQPIEPTRQNSGCDMNDLQAQCQAHCERLSAISEEIMGVSGAEKAALIALGEVEMQKMTDILAEMTRVNAPYEAACESEQTAEYSAEELQLLHDMKEAADKMEEISHGLARCHRRREIMLEPDIPDTLAIPDFLKLGEDCEP